MKSPSRIAGFLLAGPLLFLPRLSHAHAFLVNPEHEGIVSFAVEGGAPTGTTDVGAERDWAFKPFFLYGKGFGDLPESLHYLPPPALPGASGPGIWTAPGTATEFGHTVPIQSRRA